MRHPFDFSRVDILLTTLLTFIGIFYHQVTVFYIVYLFWFQEFIRTMIDSIEAWRRKKLIDDSLSILGNAFSCFFLLFIYLVFIVVLFGIVLGFRDKNQLFLNLQVVLFRNWTFNLNLILFFVGYIFYGRFNPGDFQNIHAFNPRHILLHISIIMGALIQMMLVPRLEILPPWDSILIISPFLFLKSWMIKKQ
jgi:hypothetical protein